MKITDTQIADVKILEPEVFTDARGHFFESFNQAKLERALGKPVQFVQDNHSLSHQGVLRGLHFQSAPMAQAKLIRVIKGEIFDVAVDIRESSPTFGQWVGTYLNAHNRKQLWIPEGFAHGFYTISATAECEYKVTNYYSPAHERCILWNDANLNIQWPLQQSPTLSPKDLNAEPFNAFTSI